MPYDAVLGTHVLIGTESGLWQSRNETFEPVDAFAARTVNALVHSEHGLWAVVDEKVFLQRRGGRWTERASLDHGRATCLAPMLDSLLVGTTNAHLFCLVGGRFELIESFETVEGRKTWHTPWGDPADVRSMAIAIDGTIYVNVHVGGIIRSRDAGLSWAPTVDIEADVHQVIAHPARPQTVLAAAYEGFGLSRDGGESWRFMTDGMLAHYARAVAVAGETVLVSASTGPRGRHAAIYRKPLDDDRPFVQSNDGLPRFDNNIDTACLAADGSLAVFGTNDGG